MSDGYKIPVGVDLGDSISKMDELINSIEKAKTAGADTQGSISNMNKEIVDSGKKANDTIVESAKASIEAKKATEERAKTEALINKTIEEKDKIEGSATKTTQLSTKATAAQTVATQGARTATIALRTAFLSFMTLGLAAVLAGIAIYWDKIKMAVLGVTKEMELQDKVRQEAIGKYIEEKVHVENLWTESQRENTTKERKVEIINELNSLSPEYFGNIKTEKQLHEEGIEAIQRYIRALELKARAQAAQEIYVEALKEQMAFEQRTLKQSASSWAQWTGAILEWTGKGSLATKLYAESTGDAFNEASESTDRAFKVMREAMDAVTDLNEKGPFAPKKIKATTSEYMQILETFIKQKEAAEVQSIQDETNRAFKAEEVRFEQEKRAIQKRILEFKGSNEERISLIAAADATIDKLREAFLVRYGAISLKAIQDEAEKLEEANKLIGAIRKKGLDQQIADIDKKYEDISTKIAAGGRLTVEIEKEITDAKAKEIATLEQKYALDGLKKDEEIGLARVDAMKLQGANEEAVAKLREVMKLQVMIDAAKERLELLKSIGGEENELIILQTEGLINELESKLQGKKPKPDDPDLFDILGIKWSDEDKDQFVRSFDVLMGSISDIFDQNIQRQINAKERQIDMLTDQINKIERELDRELSLQENGYANNVDAKRAELEALSAERNRALAEEEELQKKQSKIAAAQIAVNGLLQTSELALAAAKIFKAHSGIPFVGVITAIAAVATMVATFASIRTKLSEFGSSAPKFRDGGSFVLDGPSHEQGGLGVYNENTGKRVAEVEGGEGFLAIRKKSTKKHFGLLNAINMDDFRDFAKFSSSLDEILDHAGITMPQHEEISKVVIVAQKNADRNMEYKEAMISFAQNGNILSDIARTNKQMLNIEKGKSEVFDIGNYYIIKTGNVIRKIKKNHGV